MIRPAVSAPTLKLTTARLEFSSDRRFTKVLHVAAVSAFVVLVFTIGRQLHADSDAPRAALAALEQQNSALRADLARAQIELELERSTRAALAGQVSELNEQTNELKNRLDFFNAQSDRSGKPR